MREIVLAADGVCAGKARDFAATCLKQAGIHGEDSYDILLALNEAVANSCRHAGGSGDVTVTISCETIAGQFILQVVDNGRGFRFTPDMYEMPEPLSQGGRGFFLMNELMDSVDVSSGPSGTKVTLKRKLHDSERAESNGASV
ncbi:MAG: ATP-binding protein [Actinomycetota bacterium]